NVEIYAEEEEEEYTTILIHQQHFLNDLEPDCKDENKNPTANTNCAINRKHKVVPKLPLPPSDFESLVYTSLLCHMNVQLPLHLDVGVGACETVCKTSAKFLKKLKLDKNVKLDWNIHLDIVVDSVLAVFWQDNGPVTMPLTIHCLVDEDWKVKWERKRPRETSTNAIKVRTVFGSKLKKRLKIPKVVDNYNHNMNSIDVTDQLRSYYNIQQLA
ncbi:19560_t:CDS:2, partial [Cetraspora pellucida]